MSPSKPSDDIHHSMADSVLPNSLSAAARSMGVEHIALEFELASRAPAILRAILPSGNWIVASDRTTSAVVAMAIHRNLDCDVEPFLIADAPGGNDAPVADQAQVDVLEARIRSDGATAVVAVGSGTVNDVAKLASFNTDIPYAVVATAPSMNGYTSSVTSLIHDGCKVSRPSRPPIACLADPEILTAAPARMIAAGFADLMSRPVSQADCLLAHLVTGAPHATEADGLIAASWRHLDGIESGLANRNSSAVCQLFTALCISGLAMTAVASSAPLSGAEHLISHLLDMICLQAGVRRELHGCQVGVGTLATLELYKRCLDFDSDDLDIERCIVAHPSDADYFQTVRQRLGPIVDRFSTGSETMNDSSEGLRDRLGQIKRLWPEISEQLRKRLPTVGPIRDRLEAAKCPVSFGEIGVSPTLARHALLHGKDIRERYTVLHLASDVGRLEGWTDSILSKNR